jgi:hypothetical protein
MATPHTFPEPVPRPAPAHTTTVEREGIASRWRARLAERKQARLISARNRRVLAKWLRRTAHHAIDPDPIRRRHDVLLHYRAAAVRTDLLEIAALIEHAHNPDPACVAALRNLLANGCDSPLYNPDIHISELHATLNYVRSGL